MFHKIRPTMILAAICRLMAIVVLGAIWTGCTQSPPVTALSFADTPTSLLFVTPYVGSEKSIGDPAPESARMTLDEESVAGWLNPVEKILRFPVNLDEGARLTFRLGVISETNIEPGDLVAKIEYISDESDTAESESTLLYETQIDPGSEYLNKWVHTEIDLSEVKSGRGYLRFITEGSLAGNTDVRILWGQPAIYYPEEQKYKNIILIGVDTLRLDALSVYGGRAEITPNLHRLMESGTNFTRAWSQAPFTVPSFASMLTGLYPSDLSVTLAFDQLSAQPTTIAEMLLLNNFATAMICGNTYLGNEKSGFEQGMEGLWYHLSATPSDSVARAKDFIEREMDRDFFLFLHFMDPHGPYDPPENFIESLCDPDYEGQYKDVFDNGRDWQVLSTPPPEHEINRARCLYDAEVADIDQAVGELFSYLEENEMLENTLIIFAADHGEEFFEHGQFEHGQSLYEEMVHMPLMVWGPGFPQDEVSDTLVANIDIVPTILNYTGLPVPGIFPGVPLQEIVDDVPDEERIILGEGNLRRSSHRKFAIDWPHKCIVDYFTGDARLYDLVNDPMEYTDISDGNPEITQRLSREATLGMLPIQTVFVIIVIGDPENGPDRFTGTVKVPGGIAFSIDSGFLDGDEFSVEGEIMEFDVSSHSDNEIKALIIIPAPGADAIEATMLADGEIDPERFYPYGTSTPEPSGSATVSIHDFSWPNRIPEDGLERPVSCYIMGIPGFPRDNMTGEFENVELDPETKEQLRALGYIN